MANYRELFQVSLPEMANFCKNHKMIIASTLVGGASIFFLRRYFAGGVCRSTTRLDGKTVIITGANTGIGKETAFDMAKRGARVILACRDFMKALHAAKEIQEESENNDVLVKIVDLANLKSVRDFCEEINKTENRVDILINNAGIMACPEWKTDDNFEMQIGVNHLGHFLLTNLLMDKLKSSAPSRIVNVSSLGHEKGKIDLKDLHFRDREYEPWVAYRQSKLANVLFTRSLHTKFQGDGVTSYSLHPGVVMTELGRYMIEAGIPKWRMFMFRFVFRFFLKYPDQGAQTSIYCAVTEGIEKDSGKYFSDCKVKPAAPQGQDDNMAEELWKLSEKEVGLTK